MTNKEIYAAEFDLIVWKHRLTHSGYTIAVSDEDTLRMFVFTDSSGRVITRGQFLTDIMTEIEAVAPFEQWSIDK